ncbi:hypothetical protein DXG01_006896 [Tephrocybe rancida]|nr:hypothetical protein DXG01_006896 [Tephrocybe rancida]
MLRFGGTMVAPMMGMGTGTGMPPPMGMGVGMGMGMGTGMPPPMGMGIGTGMPPPTGMGMGMGTGMPPPPAMIIRPALPVRASRRQIASALKSAPKTRVKRPRTRANITSDSEELDAITPPKKPRKTQAQSKDDKEGGQVDPMNLKGKGKAKARRT